MFAFSLLFIEGNQRTRRLNFRTKNHSYIPRMKSMLVVFHVGVNCQTTKNFLSVYIYLSSINPTIEFLLSSCIDFFNRWEKRIIIDQNVRILDINLHRMWYQLYRLIQIRRRVRELYECEWCLFISV